MVSFRVDVFLHDLLGFNFANAAVVTLWISLAAMLIGLVGGLLLALAQQARWRALRWLAWFYLWLFRGTPVLLQIIFAFNVLPSFGLILSGPVCAVLALGLHEAAYMTEIIRGGLGAVGPGPAGRGQGARHDLCEDDAAGRAAAGAAPDRAADRQPVHRHAEALLAGQRDRRA